MDFSFIIFSIIFLISALLSTKDEKHCICHEYGHYNIGKRENVKGCLVLKSSTEKNYKVDDVYYLIPSDFKKVFGSFTGGVTIHEPAPNAKIETSITKGGLKATRKYMWKRIGFLFIIQCIITIIYLFFIRFAKINNIMQLEKIWYFIIVNLFAVECGVFLAYVQFNTPSLKYSIRNYKKGKYNCVKDANKVWFSKKWIASMRSENEYEKYHTILENLCN